MPTDTNPAPLPTALLARVTGSPLPDERLNQLLAACAPILDEIARLREFDLADVHPAVVFDPAIAYRGQP